MSGVNSTLMKICEFLACCVGQCLFTNGKRVGQHSKGNTSCAKRPLSSEVWSLCWGGTQPTACSIGTSFLVVLGKWYFAKIFESWKPIGTTYKLPAPLACLFAPVVEKRRDLRCSAHGIRLGQLLYQLLIVAQISKNNQVFRNDILWSSDKGPCAAKHTCHAARHSTNRS